MIDSKNINNSVVRIIAERIDIDWNLPFQYNKPFNASGTGFFIKDDLILTCAHVIDAAKNIYIEIPNYLGNKKIYCDIVGIVPDFDIGLLRTKNYKSKFIVTMANSDTLKLGDEVIAVGYPISNISKNEKNNLKFTKGIISGQQKGFIQVDSAINPGNSGGPLFYKKKVIGVNSMKLVNLGLDNIGYSVPINNFKIVQKELESKGNNKIIFRPHLLFEYNNTTKELIKNITNNKIEDGVLISKIYDESVFKYCGLKEGMILFEINGIKLNNYAMSMNYKWIGTNMNLSVLCNKIKNNEKIMIKVYDGDKMKKIDVQMKPFKSMTRYMYASLEEIPYFIIGGIIMMNFSDNHYNESNNCEGNCISKNKIKVANKLLIPDLRIKPVVYVTFIIPNSKANIIGNIKEGDFISKINDINVTTLDDVKKEMHKTILIHKEKYIKIENESGKTMIMKVDEILNEDEKLSKIYNYPLSDFHKKYLQK